METAALVMSYSHIILFLYLLLISPLGTPVAVPL